MPTSPNRKTGDQAQSAVWDFVYPKEVRRRFQQLSTKEKLEWLEEIHRLALKLRTKKEWEFAEKMRRGEIG